MTPTELGPRPLVRGAVRPLPPPAKGGSPVWLSVLFGGLTLLVGAAIGLSVVGSASTPIRLVLGAGVLLVTILCFVRPRWGVLLLVFVTYTQASNVAIEFHNLPSIAQPLVGLLLVVVSVRWLVYGENFPNSLRPVGLLGAYLLVAAASPLYAAFMPAAQAGVLDIMKGVFLALIVVLMIQDKAGLRQVIWAMLAAGLLMGGLALWQRVTTTYANNYFGMAQVIVGTRGELRASGPIGDPNFFAQVMSVLVPLAVDRFVAERHRLLRLLAAVTLVVTVLTIIFTYSRGGLVTIVVIGAVLVWQRRPRLPALVASVVAGVVLLQFLPVDYLARADTLREVQAVLTGDARLNDSALRGRYSENLAAVRMFADHPLIGVGVGNYPLYYQQYARDIGLDARREERSPHSLYLQIAAESGLVGILVMALLLGSLFRGLMRAWSVFKQLGDPATASLLAAFSIGLLGYLVGALFLHAAYGRYFWLLAGVALTGPQIARHALAASRAALSRLPSQP